MASTNRDIYNNALALVGETVSSEYVEDYEERAPYLIASFCSQAKLLDKHIRASEGLDEQSAFSAVYLSLDNEFPLCDRLAPAAALYVASMTVIDEDPDLSDELYERYCDSMSTLSTVCGAVESISERYFIN